MVVICPKCRSENRDDRQTCAACRAPLPPRLPVVEGLEPLGEPTPPEPEPVQADPEAGSLGPLRQPKRRSPFSWVAEPRTSSKRGRSPALTGAIVGALIGAAGTAFIVVFAWLVNRETRAPEAGPVFVALLLQATTGGAAAGAVVGALSAAAGGGAPTGAKVGAVLAGFVGLLWLAGLALAAGSLAAVAGEVWRALAAVGLGAAFGGVIGAAAQAATERWT